MMRKRKSKISKRRSNNLFRSSYLLVTGGVVLKWLAFMALVGSLIYGWNSDILKVKSVSCVGSDGNNCDEVVMAELNRHKGEHTFLVETEDIASKIEKANPSFSKVKVDAVLPDELRAYVDRIVVGINLQVATQSAVLLVDERMIVIGNLDKPENKSDRVITSAAANLVIGDKVDDITTLWAISLLAELKSQFIPYSLLKVHDESSVVVDLIDGRQVWFLAGGDITRQVTSLQLILSKATIQPLSAIIDLRFEKPVLRN